MNAICMICLMAIQAIRCDKAVSEHQNQDTYITDTSVFLPYDFCKTFDCPAIDDPQCVRMRHYATGRSYYFIAAHKCEFKYLKCRDDVEGTIVPMKNCDHTAGQLAGKQTNEKDKDHIRVKRKAVRARSSVKPHLREAVKQKSNILPQKQRLIKQKRRRAQRDFAMISAESANQSLVEVDMKQYEAACPTVCPSRDVMVCGICQHGIYRTFSSVCHMRMFGCNHTDEIMQLVSRGPCFVSSPFISEPGMQPRGRLTEPDDDDIVLRFIRCRDNDQLEEDEIIISPTDDGYTYIKNLNSFYKFHKNLNGTQAENVCKDENASVFYPEDIIEAQGVLKFWEKHRGKNWKFSESEGYIFIGIRRVNLTNDFVTIDGRPVSEVYVNWAVEQPGPPYRRRCVRMDRAGLSDVFNGEYLPVSANNKYDVICKRALRNNSNGGYTYIKILNSSYKLHHNMTWDQAESVCKKENASVFCPENPKEADEVMAFWKQRGAKSRFIHTGIIRSTSSPREFETIDGRSASKVYVNWRNGFPDDSELQDCVYLSTKSKYYVFHGNDPSSVICKRRNKTSNNNLRDPRCNFKRARKTN